ncbi:MAG: deoxyribonuclease IV [Methanothrix sp.]|nr:deoxyribonuclease IV [Methanothrix sp.]
MVRLGVHVSIVGGMDKSVDRALDLGCDTFQIFSSNPRSWRSKPISDLERERFVARLRESGLHLAIDHMPYLPNLASSKEDVYTKSVQALTTELMRCQILGIPYLVTHLGSHLGMGQKKGLELIGNALETAFSSAENDVVLLLENSAGTKNSMGSTFEDIAAIIESSNLNRRRLGVCLDTCHLHASGYELRTSLGLETTLDQFQSCIGLDRLLLIHLNDSRGIQGSRLDRHEHIGLGEIGIQGFRAILGNPVLQSLPMILETPVNSYRDDRGNIAVIRQLASERK